MILAASDFWMYSFMAWSRVQVCQSVLGLWPQSCENSRTRDRPAWSKMWNQVRSRWVSASSMPGLVAIEYLDRDRFKAEPQLVGCPTADNVGGGPGFNLFGRAPAQPKRERELAGTAQGQGAAETWRRGRCNSGDNYIRLTHNLPFYRWACPYTGQEATKAQT